MSQLSQGDGRLPKLGHCPKFSRFFSNNSTLEVKVAKIKIRLCTFCNIGNVEDEYHFLLECPCYYELRILYLPKYFYHNPSKIKFVNLLCTKNKSLLKKICLFLERALKMREEIESYYEIF